ncbi:MAG: hypothetical protein R3C15_21985 [Thermoleophilia bacterium]
MSWRARASLGRSETDELGELGSVDQHQADVGSETTARERDVGRLDELADQLRRVEAAEERLRDGRFGLSVESGEPIPDERLEEVPTAERTVAEEERRARTPVAGPGEGDGGPDEPTPLDEPSDPPVPLGAIPLGPAPDLDDDAQTFDVTTPGELYRDGEANPDVGDHEDDLPEGTYRPA